MVAPSWSTKQGIWTKQARPIIDIYDKISIPEEFRFLIIYDASNARDKIL